MARAWLPKRLVCSALVAAGLSLTGVAQGADLFYNYYVNGTPPAQLYLSPRPTPPLVGHTYITNQALNPHEFLYHHSRTYYGYDGCRCLPVNRTTVSYKSGLLPWRFFHPHNHPEIMFQYAP
ncbi:MAG TPA: hypothetical protein VG125_10905 [Pirellulales bacterium]|jgi:hypothetical protein|nr:hypothetical protein [Pirellulales bacterium]